MGARQSKRSVDISATPKKDAEGEQSAERLEKLEEGDVIKVQNGNAPHAETPSQETAEEGAGEKKAEPAAAVNNEKGEAAEGEQQTSEGGAASAEGEKTDQTPTTPEAEQKPEEKAKSEEKSDKKKDKKEKSKKKWSFRSISFSKKDKSKPSMSREESKSNDLAKEAPVPEEGTVKSGSEETSPSEPEAATPAADDAPKETNPTTDEKKEESTPAAASLDIKSVVSSLSSTAESGVQKVVEESKKLVTEAKEAVSTIVEAGSKLVVEESKTTTITESASIIKTSTKTIEIVEETVAPPLPASPPPTEAPPPTPVAPQPIQQHEHEEMNGGGEGMAEMPEENGLCENEKLDDDHEDLPKVNGHNESPVQVEQITECLLKTTIEEKVVLDNHLEVAVDGGNKD